MTSSQKMEVKMVNGLAGVGAHIGHQTPTPFEVFGFSNIGGQVEKSGDGAIDPFCGRVDMADRDDQDVSRRLRIEITKRYRVVIAGNDVGWDLPRGDLTEEAVGGQSPVMPNLVRRSVNVSSL